MAELKYEKLDVNTQKAQVDGRLRDLETQHYAQRLALITAKSEEDITNIKAAMEPLEKDIRELRKEESALVSEAKTDEAN